MHSKVFLSFVESLFIPLPYRNKVYKAYMIALCGSKHVKDEVNHNFMQNKRLKQKIEEAKQELKRLNVANKAREEKRQTEIEVQLTKTVQEFDRQIMKQQNQLTKIRDLVLKQKKTWQDQKKAPHMKLFKVYFPKIAEMSDEEACMWLSQANWNFRKAIDIYYEETLRGMPVQKRKWKWKNQQNVWIEHDEKKQTSEFTVPVNTPIKLIMSSRDVLHSFYVPSFRIKQG